MPPLKNQMENIITGIIKDNNSSSISNNKELKNLIIKNLKSLPFIDKVYTSNNYKGEEIIIAEDLKDNKNKEGLDTTIGISLMKDGIEFSLISVKKEDQGKGLSTKMIDAVLKSLESLDLDLDTNIYLSDPYNEKFWNSIRLKYPLYNWKF